MRWTSLTTLLALLLLAACPRGGGDSGTGTGDAPGDRAATPSAAAKPLIVWADPLLKEPLVACAKVFVGHYKQGITPVYIERGDLLGRLEGDGPPSLPDVFITADAAVFTALREGGYIDESSARTFAGDRLVLVQQKDRGYKAPSLFDTYSLRFTAMGLGAEETAAGRYAEQALITEGCYARLEDRLRRYQHTGEALDALLADEVQLVITTAAQAAQVRGVEVMLLIGEDMHEDIRYQAGAAVDSASNDAVQLFLVLLAEDDDVQALLTGYGLLDRKTALKETK